MQELVFSRTIRFHTGIRVAPIVQIAHSEAESQNSERCSQDVSLPDPMTNVDSTRYPT